VPAERSVRAPKPAPTLGFSPKNQGLERERERERCVGDADASTYGPTLGRNRPHHVCLKRLHAQLHPLHRFDPVPLQRNPLALKARPRAPDPNPILCFASAPATTCGYRDKTIQPQTGPRVKSQPLKPPVVLGGGTPATSVNYARTPYKYKGFSGSATTARQSERREIGSVSETLRGSTHAACPSCQACLGCEHAL
jgi:hypothetical protein